MTLPELLKEYEELFKRDAVRYRVEEELFLKTSLVELQTFLKDAYKEGKGEGLKEAKEALKFKRLFKHIKYSTFEGDRKWIYDKCVTAVEQLKEALK